MVTKDERESKILAVLEKERTELQERLKELGVGDEERNAFDPNFADSSQVTAEKGELDALAASISEQLKEAESALVRLKSGKYGICESCKSEIAWSRLSAMPTARLCISCASKRAIR